jgi:hypothetical protein
MKDRDPAFDAIKEDEIWAEAKDRLQIHLDSESTNRSRAKEDLRFSEGDQWDSQPTTTASMETPELTINLTDALVRRVVNNMKQQRPRGKCHPVGDGADTEIAELINGIGRHVETRSEASVAYDMAGDAAVRAGVGYFRLVAEYLSPKSFQKDLRILPIRNIFTVYMDPGAIMPSGCDQNWCLISVKMKRTEYQRRYPTAENTNWIDAGSTDRYEWDNKEDIRLAEYFRITERAERLYQIKSQQGEEYGLFQSEMPREPGIKFSKDYAVQMLAQRGLSIEGDRESSRREVQWFQLNGLTVVKREVLPGTWIPVFRVQGNVADIDGEILRRGMVRGMQDPQRMVNYGEVAKIKRLGLAPKSPWVAAEGQLDGHPEWDDANTQPYSVLTYKPVTVVTAQGEIPLPPPQRQPPAQIEAGFAEFVQGMRSNLLAVAGMPNEPGQDPQGQVVSGKALRRRDQLSDQSHFQYYDNQTLAIAQCWRVMLEWIPEYFNEKRMQRIIGEDSTPRMVEINAPEQDGAVNRVKNDLSVGTYDVVMDTGPGYETKREEGAENLIDLLQVQALAEIIAKTGPDLVFRSIDHPYMQELADRLTAQTPEGLKQIMEQLPERARNIVMALGNELQSAKQALQQAQVELKQGLAKEHLKAAVQAHKTEEDNKTKRLDTAVRSHTALAVEEIKAGASLLNTHTEAKYHKEEAERMIEHADATEKSNGAAK